MKCNVRRLQIERLEGRLVLDASAVLSMADVSVVEGDEVAVVRVTVDKAVEGGFTVEYNTSNDLAVDPDDYESVTGQLNFAGTANETQSFDIPIQDDMILELAETFIVSLSNAQANDDGFGTIDSSDTANVKISDRELVRLSVVRGSLLEHEVTVSGAVFDESITVAAGSLPSWLSLTDHGDGSATLSGTPGASDIGGHLVTLMAESDLGRSATLMLEVAVAHPVTEAHADLIDEFDQVLAWLEDSCGLTDGYLVSDRHLYELGFEALDPASGLYTNVPADAAFAATRTLFGSHVLLNGAEDRVYVSADGDFATALPLATGDESPINRYFFETVKDSRIQFRYVLGRRLSETDILELHETASWCKF